MSINRGSFRPEVGGVIREAADGARLDITVTTVVNLKPFFVMWLFVAGVCSFFTVIYALASRVFSIAMVGPFLMFGMGWLFLKLGSAGFERESDEAIEWLRLLISTDASDSAAIRSQRNLQRD